MNADTISASFALPSLVELDQLLVAAITSKLREWLHDARPGFCARLDDLSSSLMMDVAKGLYDEFDGNESPRAHIRLLSSDTPTAPWECRWTEAVRLRNLDEHAVRRPPFLLLAPPGTQYLGSLDTDTFTAIPCEHIVDDIISAQLRKLPDALAPAAEFIKRRDVMKRISDVQRARYVLAITQNSLAEEAAGLALCLVGLWPHRNWLKTGDQRNYWLTKNEDVSQQLRRGNTSLLQRIAELKLSLPTQGHRLYSLLSSCSGFEAAAELVAVDSSWSDLDFGQWSFASQPSTVVIELAPLALPQHEDGYAVLPLGQMKELPLAWTVQPSPAQVPELSHYLVELLSTTGDTIQVLHSSEAISPGKSAKKSYKLKNLLPLVESDALPEGLYRARVTAWAHATNITRQTDDASAASNISEYFWIKNSGQMDDTVTAPPPKERLVANLLAARRETQWTLLESSRDPWELPEPVCNWDGAVSGRAFVSTCVIRYGSLTFRVRLSNLLRRIEGVILSAPESLGALRADLTKLATPSQVPLARRADVPDLAAGDSFLVARAGLFGKIRGPNGSGTIETTDLLALRDEILRYVREYVKLLADAEQDVTANSQQWLNRVGLVAIDTVRVTLPGLSDQTSVAILLAPTHPLRLLWSLQATLLGEAWLREAWSRGSATVLTQEIREALRGELQPVNVPPVLFDRRRVGYLQADSVAPGWDAYLPADILDKQLAVSRLTRALGYTGSSYDGKIRVDEIAARAQRYLEQHPYVDQLQINVFNPGDGSAIADLLGKLDQAYPDLRYDVRLFSPDSVRQDLGAALDKLVNPEVNVGEAAEKYSQTGTRALHPNLTYSKNRIADFLTCPARFRSHIALVLDLFRPTVDVAVPFEGMHDSRLHGLVQEENVRYQGGNGSYAWERQVMATPTAEISGDASESALLAQGLNAMQHFVAALGASPSVRTGQLPTVRLDLSVEGQNLLYEIHRVSDWVLTCDHHLGIDYFDSATPQLEVTPGILLDFSPEFPIANRPPLMLTTRVGREIDALVAPALERLNLNLAGAGAQVVEWLRSLSGRLAMRLLAFPMAAQGVVGMALARAYLQRLGMLDDMVVIPVDAHAQLLRSGRNDGESEERTDLILARRVANSRQIEFALVEVKCTGGLLPAAAYASLRQKIEVQVGKTQAALEALFDTTVQTPDRLDRPLRNMLLANWLEFYLERSHRYRLISADAEQQFREMLSDLDNGYTLSFRQAGLVFELEREEDLEDSEGDVHIYRIGRPTCERLLRGTNDALPTPPRWDRTRATLGGKPIWQRPQEVVDTNDSQADVADSRDRDLVGTGGRVEAGRPISDSVSASQQTGITTAASDDSAVVPGCHYLVGDGKVPVQWGVLGKLGNDLIGLDLNGTNTLSIFGVQGGGKSYTMGTILEMALRPLPGLNVLPSPLAAVVFHYNDSQDYAPEFTTMSCANQVTAEITRLREEYGAEPAALSDIMILTPEDKVDLRRDEYPDLVVEPIAFHPAELTIQDWRFLMGAVGNDSLYIKELNLIMRSLRKDISVDGLRQGIEDSELTENQRRLARLRLRFAERFVNEGRPLREKLYPGRLIIVDLRDELIETDEALGLFVVMLRVFAGATHNGKAFSKLIAFDEAHKYIRNADLVDSVVEVIRQMRHQATSVLIASQDPPSLPLKVMELSSLVVLHRMDSPAWLKYIQKAITALGDLTAPALARLRPGEAYLWARSATDPMFTHRAVRIQCRPRVTQHGGATRTASEELG
jgi:DNA phosphorothioation-dependent restriction protein DptH